MKSKDIVNKIKDDANKVEVPNVLDKIIIQAKNIEIKENTVEEKTNIYFPRKPKWKLAFICVMLILISSLIIGVIITNNNKIVDEKPYEVITNMSKPKKTYAIQAVSLVGLAGNYDDNQNLSGYNHNQNRYHHYEISSDITNYLFTLEELSNSDNFIYQSLECDNHKYDTKIKIKINSESKEEFILYFKETKLDDFDHVDIDELSSIFEGLIVFNDSTYQLRGSKDVDEDEIEIEMNLYFNKFSYLKVEQEIEHNENEYSYEYYSNGVLQEKFELEKEKDGETTKINLEVLTEGKEKEYNFRYCEDSIEVEYEQSLGKGRCSIKVNDDNYSYTFEGSDEVIEHNRRKNSKK